MWVPKCILPETLVLKLTEPNSWVNPGCGAGSESGWNEGTWLVSGPSDPDGQEVLIGPPKWLLHLLPLGKCQNWLHLALRVTPSSCWDREGATVPVPPTQELQPLGRGGTGMWVLPGPEAKRQNHGQETIEREFCQMEQDMRE